MRNVNLSKAGRQLVSLCSLPFTDNQPFEAFKDELGLFVTFIDVLLDQNETLLDLGEVNGDREGRLFGDFDEWDEILFQLEDLID